MVARAHSLVLVLLQTWRISCVEAYNERPIIGVLTQPLNVEMFGTAASDEQDNRTYIAASYVKFAESAGARVVPIHFDAPDSELQDIFQHINGLIFPGGGVDIQKAPGNRFREAADLLYSLALKANDEGDPFPIHGTCLGFQLLSLIAAQDDAVLCNGCYDTEGIPMPLHMTPAGKTSKLFSGMPATLLSAVTSENITENSHRSGVEPQKYTDNAKLKEFFQVLSTNSDTHGRSFASTIEARKYPISATQWHPEKNNFEWGKIGKKGFEAIPHSSSAVLLSQYMANNFVDRARKSSHRFATAATEKRALIYNFPAVPDPQGYYTQMYLWHRVGQQSPTVIV